MRQITNAHARRFLLTHHGLYGLPRFEGKEGMLAFIRQAGCVQYDPVDLVGRSPELVFLARVPNYEPSMLYGLLYHDRVLVDHFDKNLAIYPVEDWPYFRRLRAAYGVASVSEAEIAAVKPAILAELRARGPLNSQELTMRDKVRWHWGPTTLARAAMDNMHHGGELCVHSKAGVLKTYDLAENCLPQAVLTAPEPLPDDTDYHAWRVKRRIRAVGLLWNRASDAWLGIGSMKAAERAAAFARLTARDEIVPLSVESIREPLYIAREDLPLLDQTQNAEDALPRAELLAPLDSLLWDRRLIKALFAFDYTWEIYTSPAKRLYGPYTLPILYNDTFVGRVQGARDRDAGTFGLAGLWWEQGVRPDAAMKRAVLSALKKLAKLNGVKLAVTGRDLGNQV